MSQLNGNSHSHRTIMDFMETAQYNAPSSSPPTGQASPAPLPRPWIQCRHPNGDIYFFNSQLRLITPDNVRDPYIRQYILDARDDHLECLRGDPNRGRLPPDFELVISEVSDDTAVIRMYSRSATEAYVWTEDRGLQRKSRENFWSFVAEYPSHHNNLPPHTEDEFAQALYAAKTALREGQIFAFSERQIDQIISRYQYLINLRSQGRYITPSLAWLVGAVMPLDAVGRVFDNLDYLTTNV